MRKARSEGNRVSDEIKKNGGKWKIADVDLADDDLSVFACGEAIRKNLIGESVGFLLISAGVKSLIVVLNIPESLYSEINGLEFFEKSLEKVNAVKVLKRDETILNYYCLSTIISISNPTSLKSIIISSATNYLKMI